MRDIGDKSSNHRGGGGGNHHHHSNSSSGGKNINSNTAGLFADIKAESSRGLELLDKIVNDAAQVKWILKSVLTSVSEIESSKPVSSSSTKCQNCNANTNAAATSSSAHHTTTSKKESSSSGSPSKEKRDKKAKKAVLPMVSGHTVQRPSINITRVDAMARQREGSASAANAAIVNEESTQRGAEAAAAVAGVGGDGGSSGGGSRRRPGPSSRTRPTTNANAIAAPVAVVGNKRARDGSDDEDNESESVKQRGGKKERKGRDSGKKKKRSNPSRTRSHVSSSSSGRSSTRKAKRSRSSSSSSSSSRSRSSSSGSGSSTGSSSSSGRSSRITRGSDLLSVGGGGNSKVRGSGRDVRNKSVSSSGKSPTRKQQQQAKKSSVTTPSTNTSPQVQHHPHGSASSRFLSSTHHVNEMKKKYIEKNVRVKVTDVSRLTGFRKTVRLSDLDESLVRVYWRDWRKATQSQNRRGSSCASTTGGDHNNKPAATGSPQKSKPPPPSKTNVRRIGPKSKLAGLRAKDHEGEEGEQQRNNNTQVTTTAEALRAKLREKFNKFKLTKNMTTAAAAGGGSSGSGNDESNSVALPDSTTNSNGSGNGIRVNSSNTVQLMKVDKAKSNELDAIGLSVFVSAGERKQHESVDEFVEKAMMMEGGGGARSDLLEMKRDAWILMQNNKTGISSLRDDVNKGLKRVVGFGKERDNDEDDDDNDDFVREEHDNDGHYLVGNFYFIAREGHPLALMRYIGSNTLPPCDSNDKDAPPRGFMPVDLSSLTQAQISQLQELGSGGGGGSNCRSTDNEEEVDDDDDEEEEEHAHRKSNEVGGDDDVHIVVPTINFDDEDESDSDGY